MRRVVFVCVAMVLLALPLHATTVREEMLVSTDWLQNNLGKVTILHIGDVAGYGAGHIPGAVLVESASLLVQRDETPNELPPVDVLERIFRNAGLGAGERIIVYSSDPILAARAWFTLDYLGHGDRTALLDGGLAKWVADGYATSTERVTPQAGAFQARVAPQTLMRIATFREMVRLRDQLGPNLVVIDARPAESFSAGHIPSAVSCPYGVNLGADGAFLPVYDLRMIYRQAGVSAESENIVYCRTGMQASVTYFVLRYLGYEVALYDGSYFEWSSAGETTWS